MATLPISNPAAPVTLQGSLPPMPAVARILSRFDRDQLAGFIAVAIDLADAMEGDSDLEDNADQEASDGDDRDQAWIEWQSLRAHQRKGPLPSLEGQEDDEDDDPREEDDGDSAVDDSGCDDINDDREDEAPLAPAYGIDQTAGPLPIGYAGAASEARPHLIRIRATRCDRLTYDRYRLHDPYPTFGGACDANGGALPRSLLGPAHSR